jgi:hypothetical protein
LFTSDLDISKSVGMLQTKFAVPISFICTYDTIISYFVPINNVPTNNNYYYWYSALGPVWAETRAQSGDWYGYGTLHPGQVLRGSLPLLSPAF